MAETLPHAAKPAPRGLSTADAAHYISFSESFLRKARIGLTNTPGPKFKKIGKKVVYLREDLDTFLDEGDSANEYGA